MSIKDEVKVLGPAGLGCLLVIAFAPVLYSIAAIHDLRLNQRIAERVAAIFGFGPKVVITSCDGHVTGSRRLVLDSLALENRSDRAAKDIEIACTLVAPSGTNIGVVKNTLFVRLESRGHLSIPEPWDFGEADRQTDHATCRVAATKGAD